MHSELKIESSEYRELGRVIRWFVLLRWIATIGVVAALVVGRYGMHYDLPYGVLFFVSGLLLASNFVFSLLSSGSNLVSATRKLIALQFQFQTGAD